MGRFYELPSCSWVSTESFTVDAQASLEKSIGFFSHVQSGVSLIWGVGQLESELTLSPAQAVIDNEILAYVNRYHRGVDDTDEDLAVEASRRVGIGGNFLTDPHTMDHFRTEFFEPGLLQRTRRENWREKGAPALSGIAEAKADALMAQDAEPCVTGDQSRALRDVERRFLSRL